MNRDWDMIGGDGGTDDGIKPERGDCYPEQWIGPFDWIGRPIGWEKAI